MRPLYRAGRGGKLAQVPAPPAQRYVATTSLSRGRQAPGWRRSIPTRGFTSMILFEVLAVLLLIVANGVLAMSEIAVITARQSRLATSARQGNARARAALALKEEPTQFLSTVQIGITLIGILAGALGGARLAGHLAPVLARVDWLAPYADGVALTVVVALVTYLSLVIGELAPKRLGLAAPERVATLVARPMRMLARITTPIVALLSASTRVVLAPFPVASKDDADVTEEDIRAMIAQATLTGAVHETEQDILERVFLLGDRRASAVMTPRPDIEWVDVNATPEAIRDQLGPARHARYLVCDRTIDRVVGVLRSRELLGRYLRGESFELRSIVRQPLFVPETIPVLRLLELFRRSDVRMAVVLDEYGAVYGVVTLDDILEDLVSDVPGHEDPSSDIVQRGDGSWLVDGVLPVDDLVSLLELPDGWVAERPRYNTLAGLVMAQLGHIPAIGEHFVLGDFRFEVVDMDGRRIDRVLITRVAPEQGDGGADERAR